MSSSGPTVDRPAGAQRAPQPLTRAQIESFIERGYLVLRGCLPAPAMRRLVEETLVHRRPTPAYRSRGEPVGGPPIEALDLTDPSTWGAPSLYLDTRRTLAIAEFAPALWGALASLVGGDDRLVTQAIGQTLILNADRRPPPCPPLTPDYCGDLHWHIDAPSRATTLRGRRDALVLLILWSKVEPGGGGTLFCGDSLTPVVRQLEDTERGVDTVDRGWGAAIARECADVFEFTGEVGDVLISHAFALHAGHYNYSGALRALENPTIMVRRALDYSPTNPRPSPVEAAVIRRLRRGAEGSRAEPRPATTMDPSAEIAALTGPSARAESGLYRRLQAFLPVPPAPAWLPLLSDRPVLHARARRVRGVARLWLLGADGAQRVIDLEVTRTGARRRVAARGSAWTRCDPRLATRWRGALVAFAERLAWVQRAIRGEAIASEHRPGPAEEALAASARALRERARPRPTALAHAEVRALGLPAYLALVDGDTATLSALVDDPEGALAGLPAWIRVLVQAAAGDVAGLAASIRGAASEGPLAIIEGLALAQIQCVDAAYERLVAGLRHLAPHERAHHYVPLARLAAAKGDDAQATRLLMAALQARADDERLTARVTGELLRLGDFGRAAALLRARAEREPPDPAVLEGLAALESWCGRLDEARAWATRALEIEPDRVGPRRVLAICDALSGAPARALEALLAIDAPGDAETKTWIAELLAEQGERARAMDYLGLAAAQSRSVAHALIQLLIDRALVHPEKVGYAESLGLRAPTSTDDLLDQVRGRLRKLHGNRTTTLTRMPSPAPGGPELLTLVRAGEQDVRKVSRNAAAELLKAIRHRAPDDLHRAFAALVERFPASPHPWCYWGELHLWLGELDAAEACFRRPVARDARWAYVGRAAIHLLRGEFAEAHAEFDAVSREYRPLPGATTHVYAGELYRRQGELRRALAELDVAVEAKPGRVGARINRVLCNAALGQGDAALREARDLQERYPWIFLSAARTIDAPTPTPTDRLVALMEAALRSMRGNRSSHTITFFDARGRLRTLEDAETWRAFADERRTIVAQEIERRLLT